MTKEGCNKPFTETAGGAKADRPALGHVLAYVRVRDTLVVWRLDALYAKGAGIMQITRAVGIAKTTAYRHLSDPSGLRTSRTPT